MLTLLLCLIVIGVVYKAWGDTYSKTRGNLGIAIVLLLLIFGAVFPFSHGEYIARQSDAVKVYDVADVAGKYYYFEDGKWKNVLGVPLLTQSDKLSVVDRKAPFSLWYCRNRSVKLTFLCLPGR